MPDKKEDMKYKRAKKQFDEKKKQMESKHNKMSEDLKIRKRSGRKK